MPKYLIDVNLPYYFNLWHSKEFVHQIDVNAKATDKEIWEYAKTNQMTIITKDSDFSNRMLISTPPPRVIHIKFGNKKMNEFYDILNNIWPQLMTSSQSNKLVNVFEDRIEEIQ